MYKWSAEQLKEALSKADILRPIVIYVNPLDEQTLVEALGDMNEKVIIKPCEIIERGTAYAFKDGYERANEDFNKAMEKCVKNIIGED